MTRPVVQPGREQVRRLDPPFVRATVRSRARKAWAAANKRIAEEAERAGREVKPGELYMALTPHEVRHCAASYERQRQLANSWRMAVGSDFSLALYGADTVGS
jgi:hypothetical protein